MNPTEKLVRDANRRVFESKDFDEYDANPSIFEKSRQEEISAILSAEGRGGRLLDIGCGTGNILRLARPHFAECVGVDLSTRLLGELRRRERLAVAASDAAFLPFRAGSFDMVTMYALVHHLLDPEPVFRAAWRVLKPGGRLYLDHDPNYYFGRIHHIYYRIRWSQRPGFGSWDAELSEWHHTRTGGVNPETVRRKLARAGFGDIRVGYRITTNPALPLGFRVIRSVMQAIVKVYPFKSLHTHFRVQARK